MKHNILYVFDEIADFEPFFDSYSDRFRVFLCPISSNWKKISSVLRKFQSTNRVEVTLVPFIRHFNEKAFSIRGDYIKFISEFADAPRFKGRNLKEYFRCPFKQFSTWWFSLIAEKNPLKTNSYHKLVKLLTILDLQNKYSCNKIWLDISDRELAEAITGNTKFRCNNLKNYRRESNLTYFALFFLKTVKPILHTMYKIIFIKKTMLGLNGRKKILKNSRFLLVTYFPLVDKKSMKQEKFINKYYAPLQKALEKKYKDQFAWLALDIKSTDFSWRESIRLASQINKWRYPFFFCKEFLKPIDLLIMTLQYSYVAIKFLMKASYLSRNFKYMGTDINIWSLFKDDWYRSFCGWTLIEGLLYYCIFSRTFQRLREDTIVTYIAENHAWEKALNIASRRKGELKVIGIQHTIVPLLLLNYFNDKAELQEGNYIQTMPRPDHLACVGKIPVRLFLESGWDKSRVFVWGAIRFQHFKHQIDHKISWKGRENKVVAALSIMPEESGEVLLYIYQAFKDQQDYQVIIKGHPSLPVSPLLASLNIELDRNIFQIVDTPLNELLSKVKALIVTESSAALESIACQCPVIIPCLSRVVDMNPLSGISDLPIYVESPEGLKKTVNEIMEKKESPLLYENCKAFIEDYCEFPHLDEDFLEKIERKMKG